MRRLLTYLNFNGNCRKAMNFYLDCLGGDLFLQTLSESPQAEKIPESMGQLIVLARLESGNITLLGSDLMGEGRLLSGNNISIWMEVPTEKEIQSLYKKLIRKGKSTYPLQRTFWGSMLGGVKDQYGHYWLLYSSENQVK